MSKLSALVLIATIATAAGALPAFAQAFDPDAGTGNIVPFNAAPPALQVQHLTARPARRAAMVDREAGLHAFAMIPGPSASGTVPFGLEAPDRFGIESQR